MCGYHLVMGGLWEIMVSLGQGGAHHHNEKKAEGLRYIFALLKPYIKVSHHSLIDKPKTYRLARLLDELTVVQTADLTE